MAQRELEDDELQTILELRQSATVVVSGGNSVVAKVEALGETFAVKQYGGSGDPGERLRRESYCVAATTRHDSPGFAELRGVDEPGLLAVYTWIDGGRPSLDDTFVESALAFLERLHVRSSDCPSRNFPTAVDAVLEPGELLRQIEVRARDLAASDVQQVAVFASDGLGPAALRLMTVPEPHGGRHVTLSPSDFGPHNVLCRNGSADFTCIDLEFFGWDDATKLVCDSLLHPLTDWTSGLAETFLEGCSRIYDLSPERVLEQCRWYALKWAAIVARRAESMLRAGDAGGADVMSLAQAYLRFGLQPPGEIVGSVDDVVALRHGKGVN